jgi:electron transfer flavoprotein alpha/beta subunit
MVNTDIAVEPLTIAKIIRAIAAEETLDPILLDKQVIDDDSNQTGQMLAALLDVPQISDIIAVEALNRSNGRYTQATPSKRWKRPLTGIGYYGLHHGFYCCG